MQIFVINLPEAKSRLKSIQVELAKVNLDYKIITPVKSPKRIKNVEGWTTGANSLRLTTIAIIKKAIEDDLDYIWIWEDDCLVNKHRFEHTMEFLPKMLEENQFDFIHFNFSDGYRFSMFTRHKIFRKTNDGVRNCQSYIISKNVFEEYLKYLENEVPIDEVTKFLHQKRGRSFIVDTKPVSHEENKFSYIRRKIVNY